MSPGNKFPLEKSIGLARQLIVFLSLIMVLMINIRPFLAKEVALLDFGSFYASGLQLQNGQNPYSPDSEFVLDINYRQVGAGGKMINLNPPISAMIFGIIARFDPNRSFRVWQIGSAALFTALLFLLTGTHTKNVAPTIFIWAFTMAGYWQTLLLGQIYVFLFLFAALGWSFIEKEDHFQAGIMIGLVVALKPQFMIWPVFLLSSGYVATFFASSLTGLLISLVPLFSYGIEIYKQWFEATSLRRTGLVLPGNSSILGLTARFDQIPLGILMSIFLVILLLYLARSRNSTLMERPQYVSALAIVAAILASPISWVGYTIFLIPIFFSLRRWNYLVILGAAFLSFPFEMILRLWHISFSNFVIFGWIYGWGLLFLLTGLLRDTVRNEDFYRSVAN